MEEIHQEATPTTVKSRQRSATNTKNSTLAIGYSNVQGKVGVNKKVIWQEINSIPTQDGWDVIVMIETHWQGG